MTSIQIVSCSNLPRADVDGNSDPYVKIFGKKKGSDKFKDFAKTETIKNTLNPKFKDKPFAIKDDIEEIKLEAYDYDFMGKNDPLGDVTFKIAEMPGNRPQTINLSRVKLAVLQNCFPSITFILQKPGEPEPEPAPQPIAPPPEQKPAPPAKKQDIKFKITNDNGNKLILGLMIIDEANKKYYVSEEKEGAPEYYKKCKLENELKVKLDKVQGAIKVIPYVRTTKTFKAGHIKVSALIKNEVIFEFKMWLRYRGEWAFDHVLELPSKNAAQVKPVHRNNYKNEQWVTKIPQVQPGDYQKY